MPEINPAALRRSNRHTKPTARSIQPTARSTQPTARSTEPTARSTQPTALSVGTPKPDGAPRRSERLTEPTAPSTGISKSDGPPRRSERLTQRTALSSGTSKPNAPPIPLSVKTTRIDLEPLYADLKTAIGDNWTPYKEAVSLYTLGRLNQNELSSRIDHFVTPDPVIAHYHNRLIVAIYGNVVRDLPDHKVAPWVSANDKPMVLSKPVTGDAAEQVEARKLAARDRRRLKLAARDGRRLKEVPEHGVTDPVTDAIATPMQEDHLATQIKPPGTAPASAGGLNETNSDLEVRNSSSQPLASETGEFPDVDALPDGSYLLRKIPSERLRDLLR